MIFCKRCKGRMFIDRLYTTMDHLEVYCIACGDRKFYRPPSESAEGKWLLQKELYRAKYTTTSL
jgi:hypothetical protein